MKINYSNIIKYYLYLFYNYNDNNNSNFIIFYYHKKSKYNVFISLYKNFEISLLVCIFVKKYEVSPSL